MTRQHLDTSENESNSYKLKTPLTDEKKLITRWRNWGDHPVIVSITLLGTLLTIFTTVWGLIRFNGEKPPDKASQEDIVKTPTELLHWYNSLEEVEARRQAKILYFGKRINVSGYPTIKLVTNSSAYFSIPDANATIETSQLSLKSSLSIAKLYSFKCQIADINKWYVQLNDCEIND